LALAMCLFLTIDTLKGHTDIGKQIVQP
jgi:hypothetical protein